MEKIKATLETINKPGVSVNDLVILSAQLTDDRFEDISEDIKVIHTSMENRFENMTDQMNGFKNDVMIMLGEMSGKITCSPNDCPTDEIEMLKEEVKEIKDKQTGMDEIYFFAKHKKLGAYSLVGIAFIFIIGVAGTIYSIKSYYQTRVNGIQSKVNGLNIETNSAKIDKKTIEFNNQKK